MVIVPLESLLVPIASVLPLPPPQLPIIVSVPVEALYAPNDVEPLAPLELPVSTIVPVLELFTPNATEPLPPVELPVILSVPLLVLMTQPNTVVDATDAPVIFPTIVAALGDAAVNRKRLRFTVVDLCVQFAVKVTPEFRMYNPVPALLNSVHVTFAVIVMVCVVAARASSAAPGTMPPTHVAPLLKFPDVEDKIKAIFYSPFA